eukprot:746899-Hanusia_phi.AAC.2
MHLDRNVRPVCYTISSARCSTPMSARVGQRLFEFDSPLPVSSIHHDCSHTSFPILSRWTKEPPSSKIILMPMI